jgi:hypothetical protein
MNEEGSALVVNLELHPKQSYDLSLEDRRSRLQAFFDYFFFIIFCPSFTLPHVHAWNLSLGPRRFHLLVPLRSVRWCGKAVVKNG